MHTITFYSYKGGVGRTLLVANSALYLASLGFNVVAIDFDLEAPGLHYKLRSQLGEQFAPERGLIDLIEAYASRNELYESLTSTAVHVPLKLLTRTDQGGTLRLIPAGCAPKVQYWQTLAAVDWKAFLYQEEATGIEFFVDLRDRIAEEFRADILLIDSRTGITEIGNLATTLLADEVVCVVSDTAENLEGARAVLRGLQAHRRAMRRTIFHPRVAVSRPYSSTPLTARLDRIQEFFEAPADQLEQTLKLGGLFPLSYQKEVEEREHLVVASEGPELQLFADYKSLAIDVLPKELRLNVALPNSEIPFPYCVWSYVSFCLSNYEWPIDGLFRVGRQCFIVVSSVSEDEFRKLDYKFNDSHRVVTAQIDIVSAPPTSAIKVRESTLDDLIRLRDYPFNRREIDSELCLRLPADFPNFAFTDGKGFVFQVRVERELSALERQQLRMAFADLSFEEDVQVAIHTGEVPTWDWRSPKRDGDIDLIPSRRIPDSYSDAVRRLARADEDLWMSARHSIRDESLQIETILPTRDRKARVIVSTGAFSNPDGWQLLPFFDQVVADLPMKESKSQIGLGSDELVDLAQAGRLLVLVPQSIDRYDPTLLNRLVDVAPDALIFSRRLAVATILELRDRFSPWFYPSFDLRERRERLHRAFANLTTSPIPLGYLGSREFLSLLSRNWLYGELFTQRYGAMASLYVGGGFGAFLAGHVERALKLERLLECSDVGMMLERASALRAIALPVHRKEFSLFGLASMGAALFSHLSGADLSPLSMALSAPHGGMQELARAASAELVSIRRSIADAVHGVRPADADIRDRSEKALVDVGLTPRETLFVDGGVTLPSLERSVSLSAFRDALAGAATVRHRQHTSGPALLVAKWGDSPT